MYKTDIVGTPWRRFRQDPSKPLNGGVTKPPSIHWLIRSTVKMVVSVVVVHGERRRTEKEGNSFGGHSTNKKERKGDSISEI